jgi:hypothetical protein
MFIVEEKAIEMIVCIRSVVETIEKRDRDLGRQIRRAASSHNEPTPIRNNVG